MEYRGISTPYNAATKFIDEKVHVGYGNKVAVYHQDREVTYNQLQTYVNKVGNVLNNLQVEMENRVLLAIHDSPEFIASFYGAVKIGAVPVPVNTMMRPGDYEYYLNKSRAKVLIVHEDIWENVSAFRSRFIYLQHVIVISADQEKASSDVHQYWQLVNNASDELETALTSKDDTAFWLFSSGSTGDPKGVIHLQHDMEYSLNSYGKQVLKITEDDICFSASKLYFAYGLGNGMFFPLGAGASVVLLSERPYPETIFEMIEKHKPTIFYGVPTLFGSMINYAEKAGRKFDLSSLRICTSAGEALPESYYKKWKELFGVDILDGIGSTEALHIYISNQEGKIKPGTTGQVVPGYEAKIVDEEGNALPPNEIGDLVIKGDSLTPYYWDLHELNKMKFHGEWFYTGDKYFMDEEGYFKYAGRSDDMLKVGGIWVSPVEVESCIVEHESVLEVACVGKENGDGLSYLQCYIVLKDSYVPSDELSEEIIQYTKSKLAGYKAPRKIEYLDELPKTSSGKIQRFKFRSEKVNS